MSRPVALHDVNGLDEVTRVQARAIPDGGSVQTGFGVEVDDEGRELGAREAADRVHDALAVWSAGGGDAWDCASAIREAYAERGGRVPVSALERGAQALAMEEEALQNGQIPDESVYAALAGVRHGRPGHTRLEPSRRADAAGPRMDEGTFTDARRTLEAHIMGGVVRERRAEGKAPHECGVLGDIDPDGRVTLHGAGGTREGPEALGAQLLGADHPFTRALARAEGPAGALADEPPESDVARTREWLLRSARHADVAAQETLERIGACASRALDALGAENPVRHVRKAQQYMCAALRAHPYEGARALGARLEGKRLEQVRTLERTRGARRARAGLGR